MKFFTILLIVTFTFSFANAQIDPNEYGLNTVDASNYIRANLNAMPEVVFSETQILTVTKRMVEKNKRKGIMYTGKNGLYPLNEGEKVFSFRNKIYFSVSDASILTVVNKQKTQKTPEEKQEQMEKIGQIVSRAKPLVENIVYRAIYNRQ